MGGKDLQHDTLEEIRSSLEEVEGLRHSLYGRLSSPDCGGADCAALKEELSLLEDSALALRNSERAVVNAMQKRLASGLESECKVLKELAADVRKRVSKMTAAVKEAEKVKKVLMAVADALDSVASFLKGIS